MRTKFYLLNKPELELLKENCNFSDEESILLNMAAQCCSNVLISQRLHISDTSIRRRKNRIMDKILNFLEVADVTTVYINGERIKENDLKNYEITNQNIKKMLASINKKLTNQN